MMEGIPVVARRWANRAMHEPVNPVGRLRIARRLPDRAFAEPSSGVGEQFEVRAVVGLRQHQHDEFAHGLAVRRIERERVPRANEQRNGRAEPVDAPMRNRDALTEAGRAELFAPDQFGPDAFRGYAAAARDVMRDEVEQLDRTFHGHVEQDVVRRTGVDESGRERRAAASVREVGLAADGGLMRLHADYSVSG